MLCVALAMLLVWPRISFAQRANENVFSAAQDAFGTTVGQESIGLYNAANARGFSPGQAGNVRVEGLYYQGSGRSVTLSGRLIARSSIHVGLSAQSYPFPSPSGIADYSIRLPGDDFAVSSVTRLGPYDSITGEIDAQIPVSESFSLGLGVGGGKPTSDVGNSSYNWSAGAIGRWRPVENVEIISFWSRDRTYDGEFGPSIFPAGQTPPPKYRRTTFIGGDWRRDNFSSNMGVIAGASWQEWRIRLGLFRSVDSYLNPNGQLHYTNVQPDGSARRSALVVGAPDFPNQASSGEVQVSRTFAEGPRSHTLILNARGKSTKVSFGGFSRIDLGPGVLGVATDIPLPSFVPGQRGIERIRQGSFGVNYGGRWDGVGEMSVGAQKVYYRRNTTLPTAESVSDEWLYYASLAGYVSDRLIVYSSYSRGLEDSRAAPGIAVNAGEGVPASITEQVDAGFRYSITPSLRFVASAFVVKKPYFELDPALVYRSLGSISHRGLEGSLTGEPISGLTVVAGVVVLRERLTGQLVDQGTIGEVPTGSNPLTILLSALYGPRSWQGLSIDARVSHNGAYYADPLNTYKGAAITTVDVGARYRFNVGSYPASLRALAANLFDVYEWQITGGNVPMYSPTPPRKFSLQLTVDF